jgi:hypothetical protein
MVVPLGDLPLREPDCGPTAGARHWAPREWCDADDHVGKAGVQLHRRGSALALGVRDRFSDDGGQRSINVEAVDT